MHNNRLGGDVERLLNVGNVLDFIRMPRVQGVSNVFGFCWVFLVGRFSRSLWVFISFGGIWVWVIGI
jgi:hypothetical protein